jgi:WD40 repeat protein
MMKVSIKTNLKETKFLSSIRFGIERTELRSVEEKNRLSWNKGYGYDKGENLLYVWSTQNINFYSLSKLELQSSIVKLVKKDTAITYVHLNKTYKYTITGLYNGNLKVWRLPLSPITTHTAEYIMIHNCVHHTKPVEKVVPASDHRLVLSASEDLTLCLWSLETF